MRGIILLIFMGLWAQPLLAQHFANTYPNNLQGPPYRFLSSKEANSFLGTEDVYTQNVSALDRAMKMQSKTAVSQGEWLDHISKQGLDFTDSEREALSQALQSILNVWQRKAYPLTLPQNFYLIKTTGKEECGLPYTRRQAIILPAPVLNRLSGQVMIQLLAHELFHILSRHHIEFRARTYQWLGFEKPLASPLSLRGTSLDEKWITNPDAPEINAVISVQDRQNRSYWVSPFLFSKVPISRLNPNCSSNFDLRLLLLTKKPGLELESDRTTWDFDRTPSGDLQWLSPDQTNYSRIGRGLTQDIIHAEEALADLFSFLHFQNPYARQLDSLHQLILNMNLSIDGHTVLFDEQSIIENNIENN